MESEYRKGYVYIQNHFSGIIAETGKSTRKTGLDYCCLPAETALAMFVSGEKRYEMLVLRKANNK